MTVPQSWATWFAVAVVLALYCLVVGWLIDFFLPSLREDR